MSQSKNTRRKTQQTKRKNNPTKTPTSTTRLGSGRHPQVDLERGYVNFQHPGFYQQEPPIGRTGMTRRQWMKLGGAVVGTGAAYLAKGNKGQGNWTAGPKSTRRANVRIIRARNRNRYLTKRKTTSSNVDYVPSMIGGTYRNTNQSSVSKQSIRLTRTEIVSIAVIPQATYTPLTLNLNPGNGLISPWLSKIARHYEQFTYHGMTVNYVPSCSSTTTGRVALAYDPDPMDPVPASMLELQQIAGAASFPPWSGGSIRIPGSMFSSRATNAKFVQEDDSAPADYNHTAGKIIIASEDGAGGTVRSGYLEVTYSLTLRVPQLHAENAGTYAHWTLSNAGYSGTNFFTHATTTGSSDLQNHGFNPNPAGGNHIEVAAGVSGKFVLVYQANSGSSTVGAPTSGFGTSGGGSFHGNFRIGLNTFASVITSAAATANLGLVLLADIHFDGTGGQIDLPVPGAFGGDKNADLFIFRFPSSHSFAGRELVMGSGLTTKNRARPPIASARDFYLLENSGDADQKEVQGDRPPLGPIPEESAELQVLRAQLERALSMRRGQQSPSNSDLVHIDPLEARMDGLHGSK